MIKNYLLIAWRSFLRGKSTSVISIAGLASGLAVALLIGLWIIDEVNFNKSFKNYQTIAQVYHHVTFGDQKLTISDVPAPLGEKLRSTFMEFDEVATCYYARDHVLSFEDKNIQNLDDLWSLNSSTYFCPTSSMAQHNLKNKIPSWYHKHLLLRYSAVIPWAKWSSSMIANC